MVHTELPGVPRDRFPDQPEVRPSVTLAVPYGIAWGLASFSPDRGNNAVPIRPSATCLADRYRQLCHDDGHGRKRRVGIRIPADPDCAGRPHSPARTG